MNVPSLDLPSLDFNFAYGQPQITATFRQCPADFVVEELMAEPLSGQGEHFWLYIQKEGENTDWVAKKLANYFSVRKMDVGYGGKKDRHAITSQWFSVYLPGKAHVIDWHAFLAQSGVSAELLAQGSHERKLKMGAHEANRFTITLRDIEDTKALRERLAQVRETGVPNYFGSQRFGRDGGNLDKVQRWVADPRKIRDRSLRGIVISSARSYLFNRLLSARIAQSNWLVELAGDCNGELDISGASGPLWGRGRSLVSDATLACEASALKGFDEWQAALENVGLNQERRQLCLKPEDFGFEFENTCLRLSFSLQPGQYATSILRELAVLDDVSTQQSRLEQK